MDFLPLGIAGVLLLGMTAQWLAWRWRVPSILLLLAFGFLAGQLVTFDTSAHQDVLFSLVSLAVATILLEGGLSLNFHEIRQTHASVIRLCTLGVAVTWVLVTVAAAYFMDLDLRLAALLGAVLVVTGPTVIGPLLRHIKPARNMGAMVRWEGIVVDPIGAMLAVVVFQVLLVTSHANVVSVVLALLGKTLLVGGLGGFLLGKGLEQLFKRHLIPDYLHSPVLLAVALMAYALSNLILPEAGLLMVTVIGITLANQRTVQLTHIFEFKKNLSILLISCLFIVMSARIQLDAVRSLGWGSILFLAALIVVVRPASVILATVGSGLTWRQRTFLSLLAPRGIVAAAVTSVFALEIVKAVNRHELPAELAGQVSKLVPLTFVVIVGTVSLYGIIAAPVARWLGLAARNPQGVLFIGAQPWVIEIAGLLREAGVDVMLIDRNTANVARARMAGLPANATDALSRYVSEDLELFGLGKLLAVTPNFEVNTLACDEFRHEFGLANVYQLRSGENATQRTDRSHRMKGRPLFAEKFNSEAIDEMIELGARVKRTQITEKFTFAEFKARYGEDVLPMFVLDAHGWLTVLVQDSPEPGPGQVIIGLIRESGTEAENPAIIPATNAEEAGQGQKI
jgi:NhaP-type Na+/H+ or K+/H+ antiporter